MVYISGIRRYNSKIGVNLYPLPIGGYSLVMEYYFPENIDISLVAQATKVHIVKQTRESFPNYKKIIVQFTKTSILLSDYMYFYIHGGGTTSSNPEGYLIFYGVNSLTDDASPQIYSHPLNTGMFDYEDDKMKMNMDLDLNGHALVGVQNSFFIPGWYDYTKDSHIIYLNSVSEHQIIPFDCVLKKIVFTFTAIIPSLRLGIDVTLLSSIGNGGIGTKCAENTTRKKCAKIPRSNISGMCGMPRSNFPRSNISGMCGMSGMPRSNAKVKWENKNVQKSQGQIFQECVECQEFQECQGQISQGQMGNRKKPEKWESVTKIKKTINT